MDGFNGTECSVTAGGGYSLRRFGFNGEICVSVCVGSYCAMVGFNVKVYIVTAGGGYSLRRFGFNGKI
jgi:hypothetical protein